MKKGKNQRKLLGRRFLDFLNNNIQLELTAEERLWHSFITDLRYSSLMDRRKNVRRKLEKDKMAAYSELEFTAAVFHRGKLPESVENSSNN